MRSIRDTIWKPASYGFSTNNHPPQLHAADDLDCCFMVIVAESYEKTLEQYYNVSVRKVA